jgi:CHAT domain-containing protein
LVGVSRGTSNIPELPATQREVARLKEDFARRGVVSLSLLDDAADRSAVLAVLSEAHLLHIACHGRFRPDAPDQSGLVLVPRPGDDELISLRDIAHANLAGLEHVTLSACWGADNFVLPGRWIIGLPETLCRSGAASVLACLWPVDDTLAVAFMQRFYEYLDGAGRDEALRRVQLDCLAGRLMREHEAATASPFFWGVFVFHGHP